MLKASDVSLKASDVSSMCPYNTVNSTFDGMPRDESLNEVIDISCFSESNWEQRHM